jgi:hypothetical protein
MKMSLRGSEATEAISKGGIASPLARNDKRVSLCEIGFILLIWK